MGYLGTFSEIQLRKMLYEFFGTFDDILIKTTTIFKTFLQYIFSPLHSKIAKSCWSGIFLDVSPELFYNSKNNAFLKVLSKVSKISASGERFFKG